MNNQKSGSTPARHRLIHHTQVPLILVLLALGPPGWVVHADLNDGVVAYYPFEGNANDASGRGHDGTPHGALTYQPGISGSAAYFDGVDAFIEVANHADFRLLQSDSKTFAFWMRQPDLDMTERFVLGKSSTANNGLGLQFGVANRGPDPSHPTSICTSKAGNTWTSHQKWTVDPGPTSLW